MSVTPETDAAQIFLGVTPDEGDYFVPVKIAHKLERERDEALSDLEFRRDLFKLQEQQLNDVRAERDEARETAERYRLEANAMMMQRDRLAEENKQLRAIFPRILDVLGNGSGCVPDCSLEFLQEIPQEVKLVTNLVKRERDMLAEALRSIAALYESKEMTATVDQRIGDAYDMRCMARAALAAVKGESDE